MPYFVRPPKFKLRGCISSSWQIYLNLLWKSETVRQNKSLLSDTSASTWQSPQSPNYIILRDVCYLMKALEHETETAEPRANTQDNYNGESSPEGNKLKQAETCSYIRN